MVVVFVLMQLIVPSRTNPPVLPGHDLFATNPPPREIGLMLRAACYDCHSHETRWPWYSHVAPLSWGIAHDVNEGRESLDFSDWPHDDPDAIARRFDDMSQQLEEGAMPMRKYTLLHPEARLTPEQKKELIQWLDDQVAKLVDKGTNKNAAQ